MKCKLCKEDKPIDHYSEARIAKHRIGRMLCICNECVESMKMLVTP